jgi:hypothetical protein
MWYTEFLHHLLQLVLENYNVKFLNEIHQKNEFNIKIAQKDTNLNRSDSPPLGPLQAILRSHSNCGVVLYVHRPPSPGRASIEFNGLSISANYSSTFICDVAIEPAPNKLCISFSQKKKTNYVLDT